MTLAGQGTWVPKTNSGGDHEQVCLVGVGVRVDLIFFLLSSHHCVIKELIYTQLKVLLHAGELKSVIPRTE